MNIPDEVIIAAETAYERAAEHPGDLSLRGIEAYRDVIAEWARKEALREAAVALRSLGNIDGWVDRGDAFAAIAALTEGDNTNE